MWQHEEKAVLHIYWHRGNHMLAFRQHVGNGVWLNEVAVSGSSDSLSQLKPIAWGKEAWQKPEEKYNESFWPCHCPRCNPLFENDPKPCNQKSTMDSAAPVNEFLKHTYKNIYNSTKNKYDTQSLLCCNQTILPATWVFPFSSAACLCGDRLFEALRTKHWSSLFFLLPSLTFWTCQIWKVALKCRKLSFFETVFQKHVF